MKVNPNKKKIQDLAYKKWDDNNRRSTLACCTGSGKTKIGVDASLEYKSTLIVVPTEKLRDDRWPEEYAKWNHLDFFNKHVKRECYASLAKTDLNQFDLIIFDEAHGLTPHNSKDLETYKGDILGLTATPPRDIDKLDIFAKYLPVIFEYPLDQGVKDGVVAPYQINVVKFDLEKKEKAIKVDYTDKKTKKKSSFYTSEQERYDYLSRVIQQMIFAKKDIKFQALNRMRFLYNLPSKLKIAAKIIDKHIVNDRSIIFGGSIKQVEKLCKYTFHSKSNDKDYIKFINEEINHLGTINKLNEGADIPNLDSALIFAINSNPIKLIQQIGRVCRLRDNHQATIWVLIANNTQEKKWFAKATEQLNQVNINYINAKLL